MKPPTDSEITYFSSPAAFRRWLARHHGSETMLWVGFHKRHTGKPSLTWPESVTEALCYGWIDGVRRRVDEDRYAIRFSPRKAGSTWSAVNTRQAEALIEDGRMQPAGQAAFERRHEHRTAIYSYERPQALPDDFARQFRQQRAAWAFFQRQPPWYRRTAAHWVASAKREETRTRRLAQLIEDSANGLRIKPLRR